MDKQAILTPIGHATTDKNSLLVTPSCIFRTTPLSKQKNRVVLVDPDNIDHNTKRANKNAMEYYIENKVIECKSGLANKLLMEYLDQPYLIDYALKDLPLEVTMQYNRSIVSYKNKALLNYAEETFMRYIWKVEKEHRYIVTQSEADPDLRHAKLLLTRYHNEYCKKIKSRMQWLSYVYRNAPAVLLTLTMDPKKFNQDKFLMWSVITKEVDRFMQAVRMHFKRNNIIFPKYLWAIEGQKNGNPHIHIVFLGARRLLDWRKLLKYWNNGAIYINKTNDGQTVRYPINYVTGYITKTFGNTNYDNLRTQSLIWLFNHHSFNRSHKLIIPLNPKGCGDWTLSYVAIVDNCNDVADETDLIWSRIDMLNDPSLWVKPPPPTHRGKYAICWDDDEVYSTDSLFWANFFGGEDNA